MTLEACGATPVAMGLAIFDLDRTVIDGSSLARFGRAVVAAGIVERRVLTRHVVAELRFKHRGLSSETLERIADGLLRASAGLRYEALAAIGRELAPRIAAAAFGAATAQLDEHRRAGDTTVLLSASPDALVAEIGAALGFDVAIGTRIEVFDGHLTGRLEGRLCHGTGKLARLHETLGPIDLKTCSAYADSESDLPLLRAVGRPVAVNADRRLRATARRAGWPTVRFA